MFGMIASRDLDLEYSHLPIELIANESGKKRGHEIDETRLTHRSRSELYQ